MNTSAALLQPAPCGFEPPDTDEEYERWFRAKVQAALDNPAPGIPHVEAMRNVDRIVEARR